MAKNIEMNCLNSDGTYEVVYPEVINSETKALLGLDEKANMDEVVSRLPVYSGNQVEPVGTVKYTIRDDLSEDWLLCDGAYFDSADYPKLGEMVPVDTTGTWNLIGNDGCGSSGQIFMVNGYFVRKDSTNKRFCISSKYPCSASDWSYVSYPYSYSSDDDEVWMFYASGKYVIIQHYYNSSTYYGISSSITGSYSISQFTRVGDYGKVVVWGAFVINNILKVLAREIYDGNVYETVCHTFNGSKFTTSNYSHTMPTSGTNRSWTTGWAWSDNSRAYCITSGYTRTTQDWYHNSYIHVSTDGITYSTTNITSAELSSGGQWNKIDGQVYLNFNGSLYSVATNGDSTLVRSGHVIGPNIRNGIWYWSNGTVIQQGSNVRNTPTNTSTNGTYTLYGSDGKLYAINGNNYYYSSGTKVPKITADNCEVYIRAK